MEKIQKVCKRHGLVTHYITKASKFLCIQCNVDRVQQRRDTLKIMAVDYLGGKCIGEDCGYNKYVGALEFHHKDPSGKDFGISSNGYTRSWEKVRLELDKCVLLCAVCHREIHAGVRLPNW